MPLDRPGQPCRHIIPSQRLGERRMKHILNMIFAVGLGIVLCSCATTETSEIATGPPLEPSDFGWPRVIADGSGTNLILYRPHVDSWNGHELRGRVVIGVQISGQSEATFGVVALQALTLVDKSTRTVSLQNIHILNGDFPCPPQQKQSYLQILQKGLANGLEGLSLDRLESSYTFGPQRKSGLRQALNNAPPKIIFSSLPAILVYVDGPPVCRPVAGTTLQRVINSPLLLLKDPASEFYVHVLNGYLKAPNLAGPWTVADQAPSGADQAKWEASASGAPVNLLTGQTPSPGQTPPPLTEATAPKVYVSTTPAELILFDGPPEFVPITGTHLLYVTNTTGNVFKLITEQQTYVLIAGRWFRGPSWDGPWRFVPADRLPADFAAIPDDSPKENVKASVEGTPQATQALIANSIAQDTRVPRWTQMEPPQFDGSPRLAPIAGTPLCYVMNSSTPIVEVDAQAWFACQGGVWFVANSLDGPWRVADSVPAVIYSIPPSSPLHYLTYVRIYYATPEYVYEGYTPGYWGTEVQSGVVVYGTGYDYAPWIGTVWYGGPCTWGLGWAPCWTPWDGWCYDFGFGWGCGFGQWGWWRCHPPKPWWGPEGHWRQSDRLLAWHRHDTASTAGNVYAPRGPSGHLFPRSTIDGAALATWYGRAYNSRTGTLAAGQHAPAANVNQSFETRPGRGTYWSSGLLAARGRSSQHPPGSWRGSFHAAAYSHGFSGGGGHFHGGWGGSGHGGGHGGGFGGGGGHSGGGGGGGGHGGGGGR